MISKRLSLVALIVGAATAAGCAANVRPWERGYLAKEHMAIEPDGLKREIREQMVTSKEGSEGGDGVVGGGCGCN